MRTLIVSIISIFVAPFLFAEQSSSKTIILSPTASFDWGVGMPAAPASSATPAQGPIDQKADLPGGNMSVASSRMVDPGPLTGEWVGGAKSLFGNCSMNLLLNEDGTCRCDIIHHTKQTEISLPSTERLLLDGRWKKNEGVDIEFTIKSWVKTWPANTPGAGATDRVKEMVHDAAPLKMTLFLKNNELSCAWFTLGNIKTMGAGDTSVIQLMVPKFQKK